MKKKHICFVTPFYANPYNGPGTFANYFVKSASEDTELDITVLTNDPKPAEFEENIVNFSKHKSKFSSVRNGLNIRNKILELHRKKKIDHIYFNCFRSAVFSYHLGIDYSLNINDHHSFSKNNLFWRMMGKKIFLNAKNNFVNSSFTLNKLRNVINVPEKQFEITFKGIDKNNFTFYIPNNSSSELLYVGSKYYRKGLDVLIESLNLLNQKQYNFHLNIVGKDTEEKTNEIKSLISINNLEDKVTLLGSKYPSFVAEAQQKSDIFILPSREEAFGVSILEAMASGSVVIASKTGGIPNIVSHNQNGLLVEKENTYELASTLEFLMKHNDVRDRLVHQAVNDIDKFDINSIIFNIIEKIKKYI